MSDRQTKQRWQGIDIARGAAVGGMIIYHLIWDLMMFAHLPWSWPGHSLWQFMGYMIAASFLAISGFVMGLAHSERLYWLSALRRIGIIFLAALAVSLVTYLFDPHVFIRFGILHALAIFAMAALPLIGAPSLVLIAISAQFFLLVPSLMWLFPEWYDALPDWLGWIGWQKNLPDMLDFVPPYPWAGAFVAGLALYKIAKDRPILARMAGWRSDHPIACYVNWAGRHSLAIYLLHQPIFFAFLISLLYI